MGFGIFFPIHYIDQARAFQDFYTSPELEDIWLTGDFDAELPQKQRMGEEDSFHYLRKIQVGSRRIGVIEAVVPQTSFAVTDAFSETVLKPTQINGSFLYNYSNNALDEQTTAAIACAESGHDRHYVYSHTQMPGCPFDVIVVSTRHHLTLLYTVSVILLPALFFAMMAGFFAYNRRMAQDIHACLDNMEKAIQNRFELPIQQTEKSLREISLRNDEISVLSNRIVYLLRQIRGLLGEKVRQQTAAKEAALLTLQHQINPHFLYNTMEVFSSRMELAGMYEESDAISAFCRMLRYNMNTKDLMTTLQEEIGQVQNYLRIQKIRCIPFEVEFHVPPQLLGEKSIRFLLEPFVENSFKYRGNASPLHIVISAQEMDDAIEITIQNNGEILSAQRLAELNERFENAQPNMKTDGQRIGLNNINCRLKLFYGEKHFIRISCDGRLTTFRFSIQKKPHPFISDNDT